jgi:hypothetical protein
MWPRSYASSARAAKKAKNDVAGEKNQKAKEEVGRAKSGQPIGSAF